MEKNSYILLGTNYTQTKKSFRELITSQKTNYLIFEQYDQKAKVLSIKNVRPQNWLLYTPPLSNIVRLEDTPRARIARKRSKRKIFCNPDNPPSSAVVLDGWRQAQILSKN